MALAESFVAAFGTTLGVMAGLVVSFVIIILLRALSAGLRSMGGGDG